MHVYPRTLAAIATASLMVAFAAQANKGAHYPNTHKTDADDFNYFITAGATYLSPSYSLLDYASVTLPNADKSANMASTYNVQPGYNWGYLVALGYMIRDDFDVQGSWTAFSSEASDNMATTGPGFLTMSNYFPVTLANETVVATAKSKENLTYQQFDAHIGQYHEIHDNLSARVFAGVRYAKINLDVDNAYTFSTSSDVVVADYDSSFHGWGPEVGMDLEYKVWNQVGIVGHFAAAFLIGTQEASSTEQTRHTPPAVQTVVTADSETRMVPGIDAKLGLNVDFPFMDFHDAIVIEGGYQVAYYFDAVNQVNSLSTSAAYVDYYSDVGVMGPYLNITGRF